MVVRLIFILAIVGVVYLLFRSFQNRARPPNPQIDPPAEDMVRCVQCGINLPRSEGVLFHNQIFCCVEHRDAYQR